MTRLRLPRSEYLLQILVSLGQSSFPIPEGSFPSDPLGFSIEQAVRHLKSHGWPIRSSYLDLGVRGYALLVPWAELDREDAELLRSRMWRKGANRKANKAAYSIPRKETLFSEIQERI